MLIQLQNLKQIQMVYISNWDEVKVILKNWWQQLFLPAFDSLLVLFSFILFSFLPILEIFISGPWDFFSFSPILIICYLLTHCPIPLPFSHCLLLFTFFCLLGTQGFPLLSSLYLYPVLCAILIHFTFTQVINPTIMHCHNFV